MSTKMLVSSLNVSIKIFIRSKLHQLVNVAILMLSNKNVFTASDKWKIIYSVMKVEWQWYGIPNVI